MSRRFDRINFQFKSKTSFQKIIHQVFLKTPISNVQELDRHRDRADKAELQVRHLQREVESERRRREQCVAELEQLRAREEECRQKHRALSASSSAQPIRARASSLEVGTVYIHVLFNQHEIISI